MPEREAGIYEVWTRLSTGRLKVFRSCMHWLEEFRIFARDENGKIVNEQKFHLMAATRYLLLDAISQWRTGPRVLTEDEKLLKRAEMFSWPRNDGLRWLGV